MKRGSNRLRVVRAERDISQIDTALEAGIPFGRYWRIENGYREPSEREIVALARVLRVSAVDIFPAFQESPA